MRTRPESSASQYGIDVFAHTDLVFTRMKLHNELIAIKKEYEETSEHDLWRRYLLTFVTYVESANYQIRQYLLKMHKEGKNNLDLLDEILLREQVPRLDSSGKAKWTDQFYDAKSMFMFTWKCYGRCTNKVVEVAGFLSDIGLDRMIKSIDKRNRVVHPKKYPDLSLSEQEWQDAQAAFKWYYKMTAELWKDVISQP